jgi:hypothetical protein
MVSNWVSEQGASRHNGWEKGYPRHWSWSKKGGDYDKGRDFLCVHWEVWEEGSPACVRLHVEAPKRAQDRFLNDMKRQLIHALLDSEITEVAEAHGLGYEVGRLVTDDHIARNKCTEALHLVVRDRDPRARVSETILAVHAVVGDAVEEALRPFSERLDRFFDV